MQSSSHLRRGTIIILLCVLLAHGEIQNINNPPFFTLENLQTQAISSL